MSDLPLLCSGDGPPVLDLPPSTGQVLDATAVLLETYGWVQHTMGSSRMGFCLFGALDHACMEHSSSDVVVARLAADASNCLMRATGTRTGIIGWNDAPGRSKEEVIAAIRQAAKFSRLPVTADDPVETA